MDFNETVAAVRGSKPVKIIAAFLLACMFMGIGALWSPQSRAVSDFRNCVRAADRLHVDATGCLPLGRKIK